MPDTILHVPADTHERFKTKCKELGVNMKNTADRLLRDWLVGRGKKSIAIKCPPRPSDQNPWTRPPFWANRDPRE